MKKEGIYFPTLLSVRLARTVSRETQRPELIGQIVPRSTLEIWKLFSQRRSAVRFHDNKPVAHAGITHIFHHEQRTIEEVGAVMSWGERRNGYAQEVVKALVARRSKPGRGFFAMVDADNAASMKLFEKKLGGRRMNSQAIPPQAYVEQIPGSTSQEIVFDITGLR